MSSNFTLNKIDWIKILKGAGIAGAGATAIYITQMLGGMNWGIWGPAVTALASILVNVIRKWMGDK